MYIKETFLKQKFKSLIWKLFCSLENNGLVDFNKNGESLFINNLFCGFFKSNTKARVIFDIGANIGEYSLMLLNMSQKHNVKIKLHCFEPLSSTYMELCKNITTENVVRNNFGVSNCDGEAKIYFDKEKSALASLYNRELLSNGIALSNSEKIQLKRIDRYIEDSKIDHIDFVKIDIEGHELQAFGGFGKYLNGEFIDFIQFEYGGANIDSHSNLKDFYKMFSYHGFEIAKVMPKGLEIREYSGFMENFNYANYVAISKKLLS